MGKKIINQIGKNNDTVYLLGTSNTLPQTPWDKKDADYWGCFAVMTQKDIIGHRLDALFELHTEETWGGFKEVILKAQNTYPDIPIFMQRVEPKIKNSVEYPLKKVQDMANAYLRKYFTSTIAYMVALAIYYGYKKIILHGISLAVDEEEYSKQRSCVEAWLNFGLGKGIEYVIAQPAAIMSCNYLYGYEPHKDVIIKLVQLREAIINAKDEIEKKAKDAKEELAIQQGGLRATDEILRMFRS